MNKKEYIKSVAFINREQEIEYLKNYLNEEPEGVLFIYGPKSSGKTTLLYKMIEQLKPGKRYDIKILNLREVLISNYKDFIKIFFSVLDEKEEKAKSLFEISAGIFKINRVIEQKLLKVEADPFKVMKEELIKLNKKNVQPLIIIDELQELQEIYMNSQRQLINELFNFFVAMTKECHLAHIIISSSDGYFIERIYENSRLRKTSGFYKIDYLTKDDLFEWLNNLEKYSKIKNLILKEDQIEMVWGFLGGSCWEIQHLLSQIMSSDFKTAIAKYKREKESEVRNAVAFSSDKKSILLLFKDKKKYLDEDEISKKINLGEERIKELLTELVSGNILFFDPVDALFYPQSKSIEYGIKRYFDKKV